MPHTMYRLVMRERVGPMGKGVGIRGVVLGSPPSFEIF